MWDLAASNEVNSHNQLNPNATHQAAGPVQDILVRQALVSPGLVALPQDARLVAAPLRNVLVQAVVASAQSEDDCCQVAAWRKRLGNMCLDAKHDGMRK
jgi:hypothetical protein